MARLLLTGTCLVVNPEVVPGCADNYVGVT